MKCPHCLVEFHAEREIFPLSKDSEGDWAIEKYLCPNPKCGKASLYLLNGKFYHDRDQHKWIISYNSQNQEIISSRTLVRPKGSNRPPAPKEVTNEFAQDYTEACIVLPDSLKASAALSRRCLQHLLREKAGIKKGDLANEIQQVIDSGKLPSHIAESIDVIRNVGNFAAHPLKSQSTGEIVEVEPNEAEWNLDVLEMLFDFYFVQPELSRLKREALNSKLKDIGKPSIK
jgi:hypothetical protein